MACFFLLRAIALLLALKQFGYIYKQFNKIDASTMEKF